jgi:hypothetical protein
MVAAGQHESERTTIMTAKQTTEAPASKSPSHVAYQVRNNREGGKAFGPASAPPGRTPTVRASTSSSNQSRSTGASRVATDKKD